VAKDPRQSSESAISQKLKGSRAPDFMHTFLKLPDMADTVLERFRGEARAGSAIHGNKILLQ
jgi:hypothetical protein